MILHILGGVALSFVVIFVWALLARLVLVALTKGWGWWEFPLYMALQLLLAALSFAALAGSWIWVFS